MKLSIITAAYNRAETIQRAIKSVQTQTHGSVEHILVDGNSSDGTQDRIKAALRGTEVFISEPDKGVYDALNKGIALATGDAIAFLHSDDIYADPTVLEKVAARFAESDADIVYGDAAFFNAPDVDTTVRRYRSTAPTRRNLAYGKMPAHPAMFIKTSVYRDVGPFKIDYKIAGDYEQLCRMAARMTITSSYIPEVLVKMQTGGLSTAGIGATIRLNREVMRGLRENNIYSNYAMLLSKYPKKLLGLVAK